MPPTGFIQIRLQPDEEDFVRRMAYDEHDSISRIAGKMFREGLARAMRARAAAEGADDLPPVTG